MPLAKFCRIGLLCFSLLLVGCSGVNGRQSSVFITELYAASDAYSNDWIELYNASDATVSLDGWALTDNANLPKKWLFSDVEITPESYLVLELSADPQSGADVPFGLANNGEYLALMHPNGNTVSEFGPQFPPQYRGLSYGLDENNAFVYFSTPSPGAPNPAAGHATTLNALQFSHASGVLEEAVALEIEAPDANATIRYTLDGSTPTHIHGEIYTAPLQIRQTTTINAVAYHGESLPQFVKSRTFVFPEQVFTQEKPADYPDLWNLGKADYAMDTRVYQMDTTAAHDSLSALPSLFISADVDDFFVSGLYAELDGHGIQSEREGMVELVSSTGEQLFATRAGLRMHGFGSRHRSIPKHSLRLYFRPDYGESPLNTQLYPNSARDEFYGLVLKGFLDFSWMDWSDWQRERAQFVKDEFVSQTFSRQGYQTVHGKYVHVYINGLYWGIFDLRERVDEDFLNAYLPQDDTDTWDIVTGLEQEPRAGTQAAWLALNTEINTAVDAGTFSISQIEDRVNVSNLADYVLMNIWSNNSDWLRANWTGVRALGAEDKFHFVQWDSENTVKTAEDNDVQQVSPGTPSNWHRLFLQDPEYRVLFADKVYAHLFNHGPMTQYPASGRYLNIANQIEPALIAESARWGDQKRAEQPYTLADWQIERDRLLADFFPARNAFVISHFIEAGYYPAIKPPIVLRDDTPALKVSLLNPNESGTMYYTLDGSDPRVRGGAVSEAARIYDMPIEISETITLNTRVLKDSEWSPMHTQLLAPNAYANVRISEILYHPLDDDLSEYVKITNYGSTTVPLRGMRLSGDISHTFKEDTLLAPSESIVVTRNALALSLQCPTSPIAGNYNGRLPNSGGKVRLRTPNDIILDEVNYGDGDTLWATAADQQGYALVLRDPHNPMPLSDPSRWQAVDPITACNTPDNWQQTSEISFLTGNNFRDGGRDFRTINWQSVEQTDFLGYRSVLSPLTQELVVEVLVYSENPENRNIPLTVAVGTAQTVQMAAATEPVIYGDGRPRLQVLRFTLPFLNGLPAADYIVSMQYQDETVDILNPVLTVAPADAHQLQRADFAQTTVDSEKDTPLLGYRVVQGADVGHPLDTVRIALHWDFVETTGPVSVTARAANEVLIDTVIQPPTWQMQSALHTTIHELQLPQNIFVAGDTDLTLTLDIRTAAQQNTIVLSEVSALAQLPHLTTAPAMQVPIDQIFGEHYRLIGLNTSATGEAATVALLWESLRTTDQNYKIFVRVLDDANNTIAQVDGWPQNWGYPTRWWPQGVFVLDPHTLALAPGTYTLAIGMYNEADGAQLLLPNGESQLLIKDIELQP